MLWHNWDLGRMKIHMWHRNPRIGTSASLVFWAFGHLMHISFCRWLPIYRGRHLVTCHPIIIVYLLITITVFRIYNTRMIFHSNLTEISRPTPPFTFPQHRRWSFHSSWHPGIPACWWTAFLPRLGIGVSPLHLGMLGHQVLETKRNQAQKRFRKCTNLIFSIKLSNKFQDNDVMDMTGQRLFQTHPQYLGRVEVLKCGGRDWISELQKQMSLRYPEISWDVCNRVSFGYGSEAWKRLLPFN